MHVRFLSDWPPYKCGQAVEIPDRIGSHFAARGMAEIVSGADVRAYAQTMAAIDREIEKRITADLRKIFLRKVGRNSALQCRRVPQASG